ncbi:MAG: hypothetical protein KAI24_24245, partial [Planctomycetes bacterium]|nr:hypothetical protein [Planctomycetota bacterium]
MTGELEILDERGARRVVRIDGGAQELVGGAFRVVPVPGGVRVESVQPGETLRIDGEALLCKELRDGESADVGRVRIV